MLLRSALLALLVGLSLDAAVTLSPTVTNGGGTLFTEYSVTNTEPLPLVGLELLLPVEPLSLAAQDGWLFLFVPSGDQFLVQWFTDFTRNPLPVIDAGSFLSGFIVHTSTPLGSVPFTAYDSDLQAIMGMTEPAGVPEPRTLLTAAVVLLLLLRRR